MCRIVLGVLTAVALGHGNAAAMTGSSVAPDFRGDWVPGNAARNAPLRLVIEANAVTIVNGSRRAAYRAMLSGALDLTIGKSKLQ